MNMSESREQLCPWCQTLITWDPEIGPEEECPHCFNELSGYRSLKLKIDKSEKFQEDEPLIADEDEDEDLSSSEGLLNLEELDEFQPDPITETVQSIIDLQDEAPECPNCREFMMFTGTRKMTGSEFTAHAPTVLGKPILQTPFVMNQYLCPHCFHIAFILSEDDRLEMVRRLRGE
jgi:hypothetical protein